MIKTLCVSILVNFIGLSSYAAKIKKSKKSSYGIDARMEMRAFSVESQQVKAKIFSYRALFKKEFVFEESLTAYINAGFDLQVGSNTSSILDEYAPQRQFILRDAYAKWQPVSFFQIKAGALNQGFGRGLLVGRIPFLGAQERITIELSPEHSVFVELQQAIPNNYFLADRVGIINNEGTPTFFEEKIGAKLEGDLLAMRGEFGRFSFSDLNSSIAYQSQFIGNTISGGGQNNSSFIYNYEGYFTSGRMEMSISDDFGLDLHGQYLFNDGAPDSRNKGHSFSAGLRVNDYAVYAVQFRNESDSSPAFYNSSAYGHNNMEGFTLVLRTYRSMMRKREPFEFQIQYTHKSPIESNIHQSDEDQVYFRLSRNFSL